MKVPIHFDHFQQSPWFPVVGVCAFVCFWLVIRFVTARLGWRCFAKEFGLPNIPRGKRYRSSLIMLGKVRLLYYWAVAAWVCEDGIYFVASFLFPFHSPFFVPWDQIMKVGPCGKKKYACKIVSRCGTLKLTLPAEAIHH
jgi:hypothetical protein